MFLKCLKMLSERKKIGKEKCPGGKVYWLCKTLCVVRAPKRCVCKRYCVDVCGKNELKQCCISDAEKTCVLKRWEDLRGEGKHACTTMRENIYQTEPPLTLINCISTMFTRRKQRLTHNNNNNPEKKPIKAFAQGTA